jgi:hypothetical protein
MRFSPLHTANLDTHAPEVATQQEGLSNASTVTTVVDYFDNELDESLLQAISYIERGLRGYHTTVLGLQSAARSLTEILKSISEDRNSKAGTTLGGRFTHRTHLLDGVLYYASIVTGVRFDLIEEDGGIRVEMEDVRQTAKGIKELVRRLLPPELHAPALMARTARAVESYINMASNRSYQCARLSTISRFYSTVFGNIKDAFLILAIPRSAWPSLAVRIFDELSAQIGKMDVQAEVSSRRVWPMVLQIFREYERTLDAAQGRFIIKRFYGLDDKAFDDIMARVSPEFRDHVIVYTAPKIDAHHGRSWFIVEIKEIASVLSAGLAAFDEACDFFGIHPDAGLKERFVNASARAVMSEKAILWTKREKAQMLAWRMVMPRARHKGNFEWPKVAHALTMTIGVGKWKVEKIFAEAAYGLPDIEGDRYKIFLAGELLARMDIYPNLARAGRFFENSARKLQNTIKRARDLLKILPGRIGVSEAMMYHAVVSLLKKYREGRVLDRHLASASIGLIGKERILADFSKETRVDIERIGIDIYFGSFYPDAYDLPQPIVEVMLRNVASRATPTSIRIGNHRQQAKNYRRLVRVIDEKALSLECRAGEFRAKALDMLMRYTAQRGVLPPPAEFSRLLDKAQLQKPGSGAIGGLLSAHFGSSIQTIEAEELVKKSVPPLLRSAGLEGKIAKDIVRHAGSAPDNKHRWRKAKRRASFYANVMQNIGEAVKVFALEGDEAKEFAVSILEDVRKKATKRVESESSARRLAWSAVNKIRFSKDMSVATKLAILKGYYGRPGISEELPGQLTQNQVLFSAFLTSILERLESYKAVENILFRAKTVAKNQRMKKSWKPPADRGFSTVELLASPVILPAKLAVEAYRAMPERAQVTLRGGLVFALGDLFSDILMGRDASLVKAVADYPFLAAGGAVGNVAVKNIFSLPLANKAPSFARSVAGRAVPLFTALAVVDSVKNGKIDWENMPLAMGNVLTASTMVQGAVTLLGKSQGFRRAGEAFRVVTTAGKATLVGAVAMSVAEFTIIKALGDVENSIMEKRRMSAIKGGLAEAIIKHQNLLGEIRDDGDVKVEDVMKIEEELMAYMRMMDAEARAREEETKKGFEAKREYVENLYQKKKTSTTNCHPSQAPEWVLEMEQSAQLAGIEDEEGKALAEMKRERDKTISFYPLPADLDDVPLFALPDGKELLWDTDKKEFYNLRMAKNIPSLHAQLARYIDDTNKDLAAYLEKRQEQLAALDQAVL